MKVTLTEELVAEFLDERYIDIGIGDYTIYLDLDRDKHPWYFEVLEKKNGKTYKFFAHDVSELELLNPKRPYDPSYYHNDPLCPHCSTYMIYKFEHCPKCGQKLDWSEK